MYDTTIAKKYVSKINNAKQLGHKFSLTFAEFKRLMNTEKCAYSGIILTDDKDKFSSRTIDRLNNKFGYIRGNVRAVAYGINMLKAQIENPNNPMTVDMFYKTAKLLKKEMKEEE